MYTYNTNNTVKRFLHIFIDEYLFSVYMSIYLFYSYIFYLYSSIYLSILLYISWSINVRFSNHITYTYLSIYQCIHPSIYLYSIYLNISIYLYAYIPICQELTELYFSFESNLFHASPIQIYYTYIFIQFRYGHTDK